MKHKTFSHLMLALSLLLAMGASFIQPPATILAQGSSCQTPQTLVLQPSSEGKDAATTNAYGPNWQSGDAEEVWFGSYTDVNNGRFIMEFDFSSLPANAQIEQATFTMIQSGAFNAPHQYRAHLYHITESWDEATVTWWKRNDSEDWATVGVSYDNTEWTSTDFTSLGGNGTEPVDFDITALTQAWLTGDVANNGLILVPESLYIDPSGSPTNNYGTLFTSEAPDSNNRPKLTIEYCSLQLVATNDSPEIYPGDTVELDLTVEGANDLYGLQANCAIDPLVLSAQNGTFGDFFSNPLVGSNTVDAAAGTWFGALSLQRPAEPLSGDGLFATLTYDALTPGTTAVTCDPLFADQNGFVLPGSASDTTMTVLDFGTITGTASYQGRIDHANIDVTATGPITNSNSTDSSGLSSIGTLRAGDYQVKADAPSYLPACTTSDVAVSSGQIATLPLTTLLGGDVNDDVESDTIINIGDFTRLTTSFNEPASADSQADINADGTINVQDLTILGGNYDVSGCQDWPTS